MAFTPAYRPLQGISPFVAVSFRAALVVGLALTSVVRIADQAMADTLYASSFINGADHLFTVDPSTGLTITSIDVNSGPIFGPLTAPADIAFAPNGTLYASSFINGADHLFTVDPSTGLTVTSIDVNSGPIFGPLTAPADIAFAPNGTLYASSFINGADHLFTVDPSTGLTVT